MTNRFFRLRIRQKFLLAFGSLLFLSLILMIAGLFAIRQMLDNRSLQQDSRLNQKLVNELNLRIRNFANAGYKDTTFLHEGNNHETDTIQAKLNELRSSMTRLNEGSGFLKIDDRTKSFKELGHLNDSLIHSFNNLLSLYTKRGFKDFGLEGELRKAIHAVEASDYAYDMALMLMLRRHEKDFFLRKDLRYYEKFEKDYLVFRETLLSDSLKTVALVALLDDYFNKFRTVVEIEKEIGLNDQAGVMGGITRITRSLDKGISSLSNQILSSSAAWEKRFLVVLLALLAVQLVIGSVLAVIYSNVVTKTIRELRNALVSLSDGKFPEKLRSRTSDEISELKKAVNILIARIRTAVDVASAIGKGDLQKQYDNTFRNDVLAQAIIDMQNKLQEADHRQTMINWQNEGIAKLGELIYEDEFTLEQLGDAVLKSLIMHTGLNQGALYLIDNDKKELYRISTYAYGKKRFQDHRLDLGSGLLGQAVLEKESIFLKKVPANCVNITSGLGEATPECVFVIPLKVQEEVIGVMEFASMKIMQDHIREFLLRACESIAAAIRSRQLNDRTAQLLHESEKRAQQLSSQEEELRQSTEELIATQEEMNRQKSEMEEVINDLKSRLNLHEKEM